MKKDTPVPSGTNLKKTAQDVMDSLPRPEEIRERMRELLDERRLLGRLLKLSEAKYGRHSSAGEPGSD
jgi:hypothetical protein